MTTQPGTPSRRDQGDAQAQEQAEEDERGARPEQTPLPINPATGQPYPPSAHPGFYPGYETLAQQNFWDEATRAVVLGRVYDMPPIHFFSGDEAALARAVFDRILPQDDRDAALKIPVLNYVDSSYYEDQTSGYRYASMPPDREAIRLGLKGIESVARHMFDRPFTALSAREQEEVLQTVHGGNPPAGLDYWLQMDVRIFWMQLVGRAIDAYYAHPYAGDEIGFGGPAYPRGYMRLEGGRAEPWEVDERREPWAPPQDMPSSTSIRSGSHPAEHHLPSPGAVSVPPIPGQGGTH